MAQSRAWILDEWIKITRYYFSHKPIKILNLLVTFYKILYLNINSIQLGYRNNCVELSVFVVNSNGFRL